MSSEQIAGLSVTLFVMLLGVAGSILPVLPGTPLVFIAALGHRLYFQETGASSLVLILLLAFTLFSLVIDYLASMFGAKRLGATWRGIAGALLGGVIGVFFSFPGILIGPFAGAILLEMLGGRDFKQSARAGLGALIGLIGGAVIKFACALTMMVLFTVDVIQRSCSANAPAETLALLSNSL